MGREIESRQNVSLKKIWHPLIRISVPFFLLHFCLICNVMILILKTSTYILQHFSRLNLPYTYIPTYVHICSFWERLRWTWLLRKHMYTQDTYVTHSRVYIKKILKMLIATAKAFYRNCMSMELSHWKHAENVFCRNDLNLDSTVNVVVLCLLWNKCSIHRCLLNF
jgi:hypothetical protein